MLKSLQNPNSPVILYSCLKAVLPGKSLGEQHIFVENTRHGSYEFEIKLSVGFSCFKVSLEVPVLNLH